MVIKHLFVFRRNKLQKLTLEKGGANASPFLFFDEYVWMYNFIPMKVKLITLFNLVLFSVGSVFSQVNCPPHLPLTLLGNTSYCVGSPGSQLSVEQSYSGYEWIPTSEIGQSVLLTAGNYQLVVTHYTGCTDTMDIMVEQVSNPPQPVIEASGPTQFCEGESVTLSVPTWYPYYEWSTGSVSDEITVYESGTYNVSIEDWIGCESSSNSIQIIVNPLPVAAFSPNLNGFDIEFNNLSLDATDYEWNFGDGNTSNDFEPTHTYTLGGEASMYLVASNNCGSDTAFLNLSSVDIDDVEISDMVSLYPNPASSLLHVRPNIPIADNVTFSIFHVDGRQMERSERVGLIAGELWIDVSGYDAGYYLLQVGASSGLFSLPFSVIR
jgi:hypothetical protein